MSHESPPRFHHNSVYVIFALDVFTALAMTVLSSKSLHGIDIFLSNY